MSPDTRSLNPSIASRIVDNMEEGILAMDPSGHIHFVNPSAQAYMGVSEKQALGKHYADLFSGQPRLLELIQTVYKEGRSISGQETLAFRRSFSHPLEVGFSLSPIHGDGPQPEGVTLILRDLSRIKDLEEAINRADRLSTLGALAAGLAHEIKNPLAGIRGSAQLLAMELPEDSPFREYCDIMVRESQRVNGIIEELLDLTRERPLEQQAVSLPQLIGNIVLLQKQADPDKFIEFFLTLDPSLPPVQGEPDLLTRLFLNLIRNACDAIVDAGRVEITAKIDPEYQLLQDGRSCPMVTVLVKDNGCGIPPQHREEIFTPFFTLKKKGTGLGLALCQKIVNDHRGLMRVDSQLGTGTTFCVSLPLTPQ